jgi:hypothetical protein
MYDNSKQNNLTEYNDNELSTMVYNDEFLYSQRFSNHFIELLEDYFIFTSKQLEVLEDDIREELEALEELEDDIMGENE